MAPLVMFALGFLILLLSNVGTGLVNRFGYESADLVVSNLWIGDGQGRSLIPVEGLDLEPFNDRPQDELRSRA
jgi:hypothetical protein